MPNTMADKNLSAILYKHGEVRLEDKLVPEPGTGQVQIGIHHVGIGGTDVHLWQEGAVGENMVKLPLVMGHEAAGIVTKLGKGVTSLAVGDRVAIEPITSCRVCSFCKTGRYNLCPEQKLLGIPPTNGCLARLIVHNADLCFKLPDHVSTEEGALLEPLSVAVHACRRAGVTIASKVLICGAGPIGLLTMLAVKAFGASKICITDLDAKRLELAKTLGATFALKVAFKDPKEIAAMVEECLGERPEITIECSGAPSSARTSIYATKPGGCVVIVGLGPSDVTLPIIDSCLREVDIKGVMGYANCYPTALALIATGQIDVKPLITHTYSLEEVMKALRTAITGEGVKVIVKCARQ